MLTRIPRRTGLRGRGPSPPGTAERIHPWQFALALSALLVPVPPGFAFGHHVIGLWYLALFCATLGLAALPLYYYRRPDRFVAGATVVGFVLLVWSVIGALGGMWAFALSGPLLWLAAAGDPRRGVTGTAPAVAGSLLAVAAATVPGFWWWR